MLLPLYCPAEVDVDDVDDATVDGAVPAEEDTDEGVDTRVDDAPWLGVDTATDVVTTAGGAMTVAGGDDFEGASMAPADGADAGVKVPVAFISPLKSMRSAEVISKPVGGAMDGVMIARSTSGITVPIVM